MSTKYIPLKSTSRENHEATEVAKLAVELCRLNGATAPEDFLEEAMDLIELAREVIRKKTEEKYREELKE